MIEDTIKAIEDMDQVLGWKETLDGLIRQIVAAPDAVVVKAEGARDALKPAPVAIAFNVEVSEEDVGRVVGKSARTLGALTTLTHAWARKRGWRAEIVLLNMREPMPPRRGPRHRAIERG
mgnify:FL=1